MDLVLASTSPYRREQLARLGLEFRCIAPRVDEDAAKGLGLGPTALAVHLAREKAEAVAAGATGSVVIGGDQLVAFGGRVLGKPGTAGAAVDQLLAMAGREHRLVTAVAVADGSGVEVEVVEARMSLRALTREEAVRYVEADRPLDCAGSYKFEARGVALFDRVEVDDPSAIVGLPLMVVARMLRARGFAVP